MKKTIIALTALCLGLTACGNGADGNGSADAVGGNEGDRVAVLYFHGKRRCATCLAIERRARETVETLFSEESAGGNVFFRAVDFSLAENEALAADYEAAWSSLFVSWRKDGVETRENLTAFAFANALSSPEKFREGLSEKIRAAPE